MALKDTLETFARNPTGVAGQGIKNDFETVADEVDVKQDVLAEGPFVDGDKTKLNGIEAGADVTDAVNVNAAGALMESEVVNVDQVKNFDSSDYATAAQGATADSALQPGDNVSALVNDASYLADITNERFNDLLDVNIPNPGVGEDGFAVAWDNTTGAYVLLDVSGGAAVWGSITGTLSNQLDLQAELDAKEDAFTKNTAFNKNFGATADTVAEGNHQHVKADITDFSDADYATAAQGALADSAIQPADPISSLTNDSGYIAGITSEPFNDLADVNIPSPGPAQDGFSVTWNNATGQYVLADVSGGAAAFTDLTDTPPDYTGQQGKLVKVNATENGLIFGDPSGASVSWGDILGTLSDQTDLQAELDAKENDLGNPVSDGLVLSSTILGVRSWVEKIDATGVTYENLNANGDVGTGAAQVAQGDHLHAGVYAPVVHTHVKADITDFSDADYAPAVHTHIKADITDFNDADYAPAVHTHVKANITDFSDADYATAAQGALADTALQSGDNISLLTNDSGYLTNITGEVFNDLSDVNIPSPGVGQDGFSVTWDNTTGRYVLMDIPELPAGGTAGQYIRKLSATDYDANWQNLQLQDDPAPVLGADLTTDNKFIRITNDAAELQGAVGVALADNRDVFFANTTSEGEYVPTDGGILCKPGALHLGGSVVVIPSFEDVGGENRDVQVSPEGVLYAAPLPQPGWEVSDTSTFDHDFGSGKTTGPWVEVADLEVFFGDDVATGDRVDVYVELYVENTQDKPGVIEIGVGINGATPTTVGANKSVGPESITYIPVSWSFIAAADYTTADRIDVFARRGASQDDAHLYLRGTTSEHVQIVSVPGGGGGGGAPTNLGNTPGPSTVTITSSTGSNTVVAGAVSGTAGVMTGAQVDDLAAKVTGPGSSVDGSLVLFDGTTGYLSKQSALIESDVLATPFADQLSALTEKASPVGADLLLLEDSGASGAKRKVPWSSIVEKISLQIIDCTIDTFVSAGNGVAAVSYDAINDRIGVQDASNETPANMPVMGVSLTGGSSGLVQVAVYGPMDYDTVGAGWSVGDKIFQGVAGLTTTRPADGELQYIGKVIADGKLFVERDSYGDTAGNLANATFSTYAVFDEEYDNGNSGAAAFVNFLNGNQQKITLTDNAAITLGDIPPGNSAHLQLRLIQDATGGRVPTFTDPYYIIDGTAFNWATAPGGRNILNIYSNSSEYYIQESRWVLAP